MWGLLVLCTVSGLRFQENSPASSRGVGYHRAGPALVTRNSLGPGAHFQGFKGDVSEALTSILRNNSREAEAQRMGWGIARPKPEMPKMNIHVTLIHTHTPQTAQIFMHAHHHTYTLRWASGWKQPATVPSSGGWGCLALRGFPTEPQRDGL